MSTVMTQVIVVNLLQQQMLTMLKRHYQVPAELSPGGDPVKQQQLFDDYLYLTQLQQGRCYETALQAWRRKADGDANTMGVLYWQVASLP